MTPMPKRDHLFTEQQHYKQALEEQDAVIADAERREGKPADPGPPPPPPRLPAPAGPEGQETVPN